jgi:uncharacterized protein (TIGR02145 family)
MKKALFTACLAIATACTTNAQVGIGIPTSQIDPSAQLQVSSTTKGFLPPVMTQAQRNAIASPAQGLMIFCTDCGISGQPQFYNGSSWRDMLGGATGDDQTTHTCGTPNIHNPNLDYGTMTDQEGNVYKTIVIGTQEWMAENLNTSIYRNGDAIPTGLSNAEWTNVFNTPQDAWAYYNNESNYDCPYGKLYNWNAVADTRNLCPVGWHVPSAQEWTVLTSYLGGEEVAGGKMKSTALWSSENYSYFDPNTFEQVSQQAIPASNSSGFSALGGGVRSFYGESGGMTQYGDYWSSTGGAQNFCTFQRFNWGNDSTYPMVDGYPNDGYSVRCVHD